MKAKLMTTMQQLFLLAALLVTTLTVHAVGVEVTYYHNDLLGSPVAATDEQGEIKWRKSYKPYGEEIETGNDPEEFVGYTGHRLDAETGLVYAGARHYDPLIGRFYGVDPVGVRESVEGNPMMFNRYAYGNNSPYKFVDPDGRESQDALYESLGMPNPNAKLSSVASEVASNASTAAKVADDVASDPTSWIGGLGLKVLGVGIFGVKAAKTANRFNVDDFIGADAMGDKQFRKLVKHIAQNGLKNKEIEYVVKDGVPHVTFGSNRLAAAKYLGIQDQLKFSEKTVPTRGFQTLDDVTRVPPPRLRGTSVTMQ